jgi:hypothetical protein
MVSLKKRLAAVVIAFALIGSNGVFAQSTPENTAPTAQANPQAPASGNGATGGSGRRGRQGQEDAGPVLPTPRTAEGKPDFSGTWTGGGGDINKDLPDKLLPYTAAGQEAYQYNLTKAPDPQSLCILVGEPRADTDGYPFEIVQTANRLAFLYERDSSWRLVPLDVHQHPDEPEPTFFGDSASHWESDTLVVDVVALKGEKVWSDNDAHPHSDAIHLVERWDRPDLNHLVLTLTIDDPKFYSHPFSYTRRLRLQKYEPAEFACDENNIDRDHLGPGLGTKNNRRGYDTLPTPSASPTR